MIHAFLSLLSFATILLAIEMRVVDGTAGLFALATIPAMGYIALNFIWRNAK